MNIVSGRINAPNATFVNNVHVSAFKCYITCICKPLNLRYHFANDWIYLSLDKTPTV